MQVRHILPVAVLALALAACRQPAVNDIATDNRTNAADAAIETPPPSEEAGDPDGVGGSENVPPAAVIPAQYRGRWGMVAADCTSTRGDAKGLITINEGSIKFYEARALLKEQRPAISTSFSGLYGFVGEGQSWEKLVTLTRTGNTLKRTDDQGSYDYKRCA